MAGRRRCRKGTSRLQVSALRKSLGAERDLIQTEFGRGYRFIGVLHVNDTTVAPDCLERERLQSPRTFPSPHNRGRARVKLYSCRGSFQVVDWVSGISAYETDWLS